MVYQLQVGPSHHQLHLERCNVIKNMIESVNLPFTLCTGLKQGRRMRRMPPVSHTESRALKCESAIQRESGYLKTSAASPHALILVNFLHIFISVIRGSFGFSLSLCFSFPSLSLSLSLKSFFNRFELYVCLNCYLILDAFDWLGLLTASSQISEFWNIIGILIMFFSVELFLIILHSFTGLILFILILNLLVLTWVDWID